MFDRGRSGLAAIPAALLLSSMSLAGAHRSGGAIPAPQQEGESGRDELEARIRNLEARVRELSAALAALKAASSADRDTRIADLEKQIDLLTREIERMRLGEAAGPIAGESKYGFGPAASKIYQARQGVSIGGYGELVYQNFSARADDGSASLRSDTFDLARAVLYFGYKWNDRILFNSEVEFEHATTGEGDEEKGEVSLEFAYLDFLLGRGVNVRAGLLLVPVGFINELHEPPAFFGVQRPEVERRILPTTWRENGAGVFGDVGKFSYRLYLMAGLDARGFSAASALREGRQGGSQSRAEDFALAGRLDLTGIPGLLAGFSLYGGESGQSEIAGDARVTLYDAHVQYQWRGLELRGLLAKGSIDDADEIDAFQGILPPSAASVGGRFGGWYAQAAWDLLSLWKSKTQSLAPFLRYERLDTQEDVPSGFTEDPAQEQTIVTLGFSWKPIPQVAIKADVQNIDNEAGTGVDQINVGLGWLF